MSTERSYFRNTSTRLARLAAAPDYVADHSSVRLLPDIHDIASVLPNLGPTFQYAPAADDTHRFITFQTRVVRTAADVYFGDIAGFRTLDDGCLSVALQSAEYRTT